ncbi:MAG: TetR/AcrR family transcriptional regulator [bacterium]|nr:TetR/AcrR family transcriptional regulator [bacterium]
MQTDSSHGRLMEAPAGDDEAVGTPLWRSLGVGKQEQVVRAAVEEFAAHGFAAASMNTLVRRAGISKGSLFTYFRSKAGLFEAVIRLAAGRIRQDLRRLRDESSAEPFPRRLEALVRAGFDFLEARPQLARIYFRLLQGGQAPGGILQVEALRRRSQVFLEELIAQGQERGELRRDLPAPRLAFLLNRQLECLLCAWQEETEGGGAADASAADLARRRETWMGDFLSLMLDGMRARLDGREGG